MSTSPPRRRQSPAVYRRRRLLLLVLALVVVAGVVAVLIWQPWASASPTVKPETALSTAATPAKTPEPEAEVEASDTPLPDETAEIAPACTQRDVEVVAVTDQESYDAGQNPQLSIQLTNHTENPCTIDVGTATQVFTVGSGSDVWWRSTDCQTEPSSQVVTLNAGQVVTSATPIAWDRTRSAVDTCESTRPVATGGGASYHVTVSIGGVTSPQSSMIFLY